ncbi:Plasmodium exported protein, unknown function [Plasmodium malariae]|uniref:Fam-l protein n=1 Tax=Plasmodium malariae TaxID=5858 RepID=A0A1D3JHR5_PLAMA|nr:Plasmodium exported protein, unknown function [Plasmodium malariae]XP_028860280.1 Plasmodium exported protein, unknown function [Plasmodium malariae]SBT85931.1 Plasmodium exported protein, unknown function [Plasmodium malariae]SBT87251.1 Plasmodium exported protein, unknown function [Plasmodium malariae]
MEQNIRFIFFINIFVFILLIWFCHYYSDMRTFVKFMNHKYGFDRNLDTQIYRLLGTHIEDIYPYVGDLELKIPYNTKKKREKLPTVDYEKWDKEKNEKLYRCSLIKEKLIKELMKNKCTIVHKSYNHYDKKIMNGLKDMAFFKKIMLINDKDYKKLKRKKYRLRLYSLLILFILVLIIPILDLSLGKFETTGNLLLKLCELSGNSAEAIASGQAPQEALPALWFTTCQVKNYVGFKIFSILIYCLPILILGIILIRGIHYYYKNVIKHKKIRFLEAFNEW